MFLRRSNKNVGNQMNVHRSSFHNCLSIDRQVTKKKKRTKCKWNKFKTWCKQSLENIECRFSKFLKTHANIYHVILSRRLTEFHITGDSFLHSPTKWHFVKKLEVICCCSLIEHFVKISIVLCEWSVFWLLISKL